MSTRKASPRNRAYRPAADDLESRQLLSGVVSGTDIDGDVWTLRLVGPGTINVTKQDDSSGNPAALSSQTEINQITVGGTDPLRSQLIGSVTKSASGDGKVFFQNFKSLPSRSERFAGVGLGLVSINMPGFWLGNTTPSGSTTPSAPLMTIPDGVATLRFGGVDTTHNPITPTSTTQSDNAEVELGLPMFGGTRVIIDKSISSTQIAPPASGSTTTRTVQHQVTFAVSGRLTLFQANSIEGDAANPPGQFGNLNSAASGSGGTTVVSTLAASAPFFLTTASGVIKGAVGGQIGDLRVGGNATNLTAIVEDPTSQGTDRISNFSVGGETNNVMVIAPSGANNIVFGKGMDNTEIYAHVINTLKSNRGSVNSNVSVDRQISLVDLGGDAVNTKVLTGAVQGFASIINDVTGQASSIFGGGTPSAPPLPSNFQPSGGMTVHIGGDITNSVFVASTQPFNGVWGNPNELVLPTGNINAKVEGVTNNAVLTPDSPANAFYAQKVNLNKGPVAPPNVPEAPYPIHQAPPFLPGVKTPNPAGNGLGGASSSSIKAAAVHHASLPAIHAKVAVTPGATTPKGPATKK